MEKNDKKVKKHRPNPTHRWKESEMQQLLEAALNEIKGNPENFEKPTAQRFYTNLAKHPLLASLSWIVMKCKMRHMKTAYVSAVNWKCTTGAGLLQNDEETTVKEYLNKIFSNFELLDQLFGQRKNVVPVFVFTSTHEVNKLLAESRGGFQSSFSAVDRNLSVDEDVFLNEVDSDALNMEAASNLQVVIDPPQATSASQQFQAANVSEEAINEPATIGASVLLGSQASMASDALFSPTGRSQKRPHTKQGSSALASLVQLQEGKLDFEVKKFNWEKENKKAEIELKKLHWAHELEMKKQEQEIQKVELEQEKIRLEILVKENNIP